MSILNLTKASIEELQAIEDFLNNRLIYTESIDHLIDISIRNYFNQFDEYDEHCDGESELNHMMYIEEAFKLIHYSIIIPNINTFININQTQSIHNTLKIILTSIKNERIRRFKEKLENTLKKSNQKIDIRFKL